MANSRAGAREIQDEFGASYIPQNKEVLKKIFLKDEGFQRVTGDSLKEFPSLKNLSNKLIM